MGLKAGGAEVNKSAMARALKRAASDQGLISKIPPVVA